MITVYRTTAQDGGCEADVYYDFNPGDTLQVTASVPEANVEPITESLAYSEINTNLLVVPMGDNEITWDPHIFYLKIKPSSGAVVAWNLSGKVMPTPKYGTLDISGSESASALSVIPMAGGGVRITGAMNQLERNHSYFAILANAYTPLSVYPGKVTNNVPNVTFTTDANGSYIWSIDLSSSNMGGPDVYYVSVWVNDAEKNGTLLISDNFSVEIK